MSKDKNYINMPWTLDEDARIIQAIQEETLRELELPGRSINQIIRRVGSAMIRYKSGELKRYINDKTEEQERKERERKQLMHREPIPTFERPISQIEKLNERAEMLLLKMETTNPLSKEFYEIVNEYHNVEIKLQSFYFHENKGHLRSMKQTV